jgi:hypothetical protein
VAARRTVFGVHPTLEDALRAVPEAELPEELDAILPARRRMSIRELVVVGRLCATHVDGKVGKAQRAEFDRLAALVDRFLEYPPRSHDDHERWRDLRSAARRDAEAARGLLRVIALVAWAASESGPDAARFVGEAAAIAVRALAKDRDALHALIRALCAAFR